MKTIATVFAVGFSLLAQPVLADIIPELPGHFEIYCTQGFKGSWVPIPGTDRGDCDVGNTLVVQFNDAYMEILGNKYCPREFLQVFIDWDRRYCMENVQLREALKKLQKK